MKRVLTCALALWVGAPSFAHAADEDAPGRPGTSEATLEISWSHFERFYDGDGESRSLETAFGPGAKGVGLDALMFQFGGRYVVGPGFEAWVDVPLVRLARSGKIDGLLGDESLYAETIAMGDVSAGGKLEIPLDIGETSSAFGAGLGLKAPTGNFEDVDEDQIATGGGDWGVGGELFAVVRPGHLEAGAAAGLLLLLPHERDEAQVDRGDVRSARAWIAGSVHPRARVGLKLHAFMREADRVEGEPVEGLAGGAHPGVLVPESRLLSLAPYVDLSPGGDARLLVSFGGPTMPWLSVPGEAGWAIDGKNVLVTDMQLRVFFRAGF